MAKKILIAKINSAHGIKGEVNMTIFSSNPKNINKYQLFNQQDVEIKLKIVSYKNSLDNNQNSDSKVIAKIDGVNDRNQAELLRNSELFTDRKNFSKTSNNEFYIVDLIGLNVVDLQQQIIGVVSNVSNFNSQPIIEIQFNDNRVPKGYSQQESFVFKNDFFPIVDIENSYLQLDLPEIV
ncbi:MAG: ribosome maturation factor RimM [Alphaproteobacteria bacterium]